MRRPRRRQPENDHGSRSDSDASPGWPVTVRVILESGPGDELAELPRFGVVGLGDPIRLPRTATADAETGLPTPYRDDQPAYLSDEFARRGRVPDGWAHYQDFGISQETRPAAGGLGVPVVVAGVTFARVWITDEGQRYARPDNTATATAAERSDRLLGDWCGPARILWREGLAAHTFDADGAELLDDDGESIPEQWPQLRLCQVLLGVSESPRVIGYLTEPLNPAVIVADTVVDPDSGEIVNQVDANGDPVLGPDGNPLPQTRDRLHTPTAKMAVMAEVGRVDADGVPVFNYVRQSLTELPPPIHLATIDASADPLLRDDAGEIVRGGRTIDWVRVGTATVVNYAIGQSAACGRLIESTGHQQSGRLIVDWPDATLHVLDSIDLDNDNQTDC